MARIDAVPRHTADVLSGIDPFAIAAFLLVAFSLAGVAQTAWFTTRLSRALTIPVDGGLTLRGRRVFGAHKTVRGFVVMLPAAAVAFAALAALSNPVAHGLWNLTLAGYATLGAWAALGFMVGELPNSFLKRQLDVPPGAAASSRPGQVLQFVVDRIDSGIGMLAAVSIAVPTPWTTWALVLLIGPFIHGCFSVVMFHLGIKQRPA